MFLKKSNFIVQMCIYFVSYIKHTLWSSVGKLSTYMAGNDAVLTEDLIFSDDPWIFPNIINCKE